MIFFKWFLKNCRKYTINIEIRKLRKSVNWVAVSIITTLEVLLLNCIFWDLLGAIYNKHTWKLKIEKKILPMFPKEKNRSAQKIRERKLSVEFWEILESGQFHLIKKTPKGKWKISRTPLVKFWSIKHQHCISLLKIISKYLI